MDLSERPATPVRRHPWETARLAAIRRILAGLALREPRVLDVGCGDGYLVRELRTPLRFRHVVAQDIHMSEELARELNAPGVEFVRELTQIDYQADLILLLDVLEHLPDPRALLLDLMRQRLAPGGRFLITVPAFQGLFTDHDRALKHFRRYSRTELLRLVESAGLEALDSGYLFASLLLPRGVSALRERAARRPHREANGAVRGVGAWSGSRWLTRAVHAALCLDGRLCLLARQGGVTLPGLTVWLTCKTRS
jgi:SAM-dependent methyltransferase